MSIEKKKPDPQLEPEEAKHPDYARGLRQGPEDPEHPDFARGQRETPEMVEEGPDYAEGMRDRPKDPTAHPDFARGQHETAEEADVVEVREAEVVVTDEEGVRAAEEVVVEKKMREKPERTINPEDEVDEAEWESFPASDPPSHRSNRE